MSACCRRKVVTRCVHSVGFVANGSCCSFSDNLGKSISVEGAVRLSKEAGGVIGCCFSVLNTSLGKSNDIGFKEQGDWAAARLGFQFSIVVGRDRDAESVID